MFALFIRYHYSDNIQGRWDKQDRYSRITSKTSLSFCMTTFSASLTNLTALLPESQDCSYYVSRRILAYEPLRLQKHTDLRAHDFALSPGLRHQSRLANVTCVWSWRLCGINPSVRAEGGDKNCMYNFSRWHEYEGNSETWDRSVHNTSIILFL